MQAQVIDIGAVGDGPALILNKDDTTPPKEIEVTPSEKPSVNFGGGMEFLMNDKVKSDSSKKRADIDLGDISELESELNNLTEEI